MLCPFMVSVIIILDLPVPNARMTVEANESLIHQILLDLRMEDMSIVCIIPSDNIKFQWTPLLMQGTSGDKVNSKATLIRL